MPRVREGWLASDDHEKWADAMMQCQSGTPWECGAAGECLAAGGGCFTTERQAAAAAWQMIQRLQSNNPAVQLQLDRAVRFLRYNRKEP